MIRSALALGGALALLTSLSQAQTTTAKVLLGGQGSFSSSGFNNPGLLEDGVTVGSATLTFTLDSTNAKLTLLVENTSPVIPGVANPVITQIYFNLPSEITGIALVSQSGSGGLTPAYTLDVNQKVALFGYFGVELDNGGGVHGSISNAAADTLGVPAGENVVGPATFLMDVAGALGGVTAADIAATFSTQATVPAIAAAHFQAGGPNLTSAKITNGSCVTSAYLESLGAGCGATMTCEVPHLDSIVHVTIDTDAPFAPGFAVATPPVGAPLSFRGCQIWLMLNMPIAFSHFVTDMNGDVTIGVKNPTYFNAPNHCGLEYNIQAIVFYQGGPLPFGALTNGIFLHLGV